MPPIGSTFGIVRPYAYGRAFTAYPRVTGAAGNVAVTYKPATGYIERLVALSFLFTAVGGATARNPRVSIEDAAGAIFGQSVAAFTVAAGSASQLTFGVGLNDAGANNLGSIVAPLPDVQLAQGFIVVVDVINGLAADTVGTVLLTVERFSSSPRDFPPGQGPEVGEREFAREQLAHPTPAP